MHIIYSDTMTETSMSMWLEIMYDADFSKYEYCYLTVNMDTATMMPMEDVYVTDSPDGEMGGLCPTYEGAVFKYSNPDMIETGYMTINGTTYMMNSWEAVEPYYLSFEEDYCKTNPEYCEDGVADWDEWMEDEFGDEWDDDWDEDWDDDWDKDWEEDWDEDWDDIYDYDYDYDYEDWDYYPDYGYGYDDYYYEEEPYDNEFEEMMEDMLDEVMGWFSGDSSNKLLSAVASVAAVAAMQF